MDQVQWPQIFRSLFLKAHPELIGNVIIEITDYSNGKGKNVTYTMYADLMRGNAFDRVLEREQVSPDLDSDVMTRLTDKFNVYVPPMGMAPTEGGEMVRAASHIIYRYLNDGDKLNDGYGRETVNPAARFLLAKESDEMRQAVKQMWAPYSCNFFSDTEYEQRLTALGTALIKQFDHHPELFATYNKENMFDYADPTEDYDDTYDEEEEYEEEEDDYEEYDEYEECDEFTNAVNALETTDGLNM